MLYQYYNIPFRVYTGCTSFIQPLDITINCAFIIIFQDLTNNPIESGSQKGNKLTTNDQWNFTTKCIANTGEDFCTYKNQVIINSLIHISLSLLKKSRTTISSILNISLHIIGDEVQHAEATIFEEIGFGYTKSENSQFLLFLITLQW